MSDQSIFGENQNNSQTPANNPAPSNGQPSQNDQLATLLASVRNENGEQKYKTVEEALKALQHSQTYIPSLKTELETAKAELARAKAEAERIAELERTLETLTQNQNSSVNTTPQGLSEEQIADLVVQTLQKTSTEAEKKKNILSVVNTMKEQFGDKAEEVFYNKAQELGLGKDEINQIAAKSPQAAFKLLGLGVSQDLNGTPSKSGINSAAFQLTPESLIRKNDKTVLLGATNDEVMSEMQKSRQMVEELEKAGLSTYDLSDPKVFNKYFK